MSRDFNTLSLPALFRALGAPEATRRLAAIARDEDLGKRGKPRDVTSRVASDSAGRARAFIRAREPGVIAGLACIPFLAKAFSRRIRFRAAKGVADGSAFKRGQTLGTLEGPARDILTFERTLLNLLSRLAGIATVTHEYDRAMRSKGPVRAKLLDTRKTTPGLRVLEKYAVRCGGGYCHRIGLYDAVLIKDNHITGVALKELTEWTERAARRASKLKPRPRFFEIEVDSLAQLEQVLFARIANRPAADIILLDNMAPKTLEMAVRWRDELAPQVALEASGGISIRTIADVARAGVDRISVGALTHSAPIIDLGLDFS
ncbi:MAG: carboxylating nicotinate-nucleotide diphosphorylase [Phycisphaeraceae bacterium]|nr:carboxylating nicotinate-nucleotide diphosphorylase [Phycisphaeraceae bacterium]